ncbi:hypothetical protein J2S74_000657 [Evansella vedderi]|uniref:Uncharacterized protein n=1 Tax=Evansella vedderi TaxID=38282 RepID=A0ABT9ZSY3_9BACI|nr:hypothetical protein [Evansella vedderi]
MKKRKKKQSNNIRSFVKTTIKRMNRNLGEDDEH